MIEQLQFSTEMSSVISGSTDREVFWRRDKGRFWSSVKCGLHLKREKAF
jgi:hypothetical protein